MPGMLESIVMKKCNITSKEAKKIARRAREQLQIASTVLWSKELEATCLQIYDADNHDDEEQINRIEKIEKLREALRTRSNSETSCWSQIIGTEERIDSVEKKRTARSLSKPRKKSDGKLSLNETSDTNDEIILSSRIIVRRKGSKRQLNDSGKNDSSNSICKSPLSLTSNGTNGTYGSTKSRKSATSSGTSTGGSTKSKKSATSSGTATSASTSKASIPDETSQALRARSRLRGEDENVGPTNAKGRLRRSEPSSEFTDDKNITRGRLKQRDTSKDVRDKKVSSSLSRKLQSDTEQQQAPLRRRLEKHTTEEATSSQMRNNDKATRRLRSSDSTDAVDGVTSNVTDEEKTRMVQRRRIVRRIQSSDSTDAVDNNIRMNIERQNAVELARRSPSTSSRRLDHVSNEEYVGTDDKASSRKSILRSSSRRAVVDNDLNPMEKMNESKSTMKPLARKNVANESSNDSSFRRKLVSRSPSTDSTESNVSGLADGRKLSTNKSNIESESANSQDKATLKPKKISNTATNDAVLIIDKKLSKMPSARLRSSVEQFETEFTVSSKSDPVLGKSVVRATNDRPESDRNVKLASSSDWNDFSKPFSTWGDEQFNDKPDIELISSSKSSSLGTFIEKPKSKNDDNQTVSTGSGSTKSKTRMIPVVKGKISNLPKKEQVKSPSMKKEQVGTNMPLSPRLSMVPVIRDSSPIGKSSPGARYSSILRSSNPAGRHGTNSIDTKRDFREDPTGSLTPLRREAISTNGEICVSTTSPTNKLNTQLRKSPTVSKTTVPKSSSKVHRQEASNTREGDGLSSRRWRSENSSANATKNSASGVRRPTEIGSTGSLPKNAASTNTKLMETIKGSGTTRGGALTDSTATMTDDDDTECTTKDLPIHHRHMYKQADDFSIKEDDIFPEFAPSRFAKKVNELKRKPSLQRHQLYDKESNKNDAAANHLRSPYNRVQTGNTGKTSAQRQHLLERHNDIKDGSNSSHTSNSSRTKLFEETTTITSSIAPKLPQRRQSIQDHH